MPETASATRASDVYRDITNQIIDAMERGAISFEMPWHRGVASFGRPVNVLSDIAYRGVNVIGLWASAEAAHFYSRYWGTYKQWRMLDAQVRKGERGSLIVFYKDAKRESYDDATGEPVQERYLVARASFVFNADQVDGWKPPDLPMVSQVQAIAEAETFVGSTGADIRHGGDRAFYRPTDDFVQIPDRERFAGTTTSNATEGYYATLLHELTHWTGHRSRLDRDLANRFGEQAYAMEELVAELGAAFLCADLRVANAPRLDHAAYISNWLQVLKHDKKALFTAASKASAAAEYLVKLQPVAET